MEYNPVNLRLVSRILNKYPQLRLITSHTAEFARGVASAHHPDLILLDINLPDMDGYQMLSVLRSQDWAKMTPVIAISANAMPRDIEQGKEKGFIEYIPSL
ncbi:MAG: response regulator [Methylobacter sp.]